jgi:hypothetical protein
VRELELSVSDVFTQQTGTIRSCPESEMPWGWNYVRRRNTMTTWTCRTQNWRRGFQSYWKWSCSSQCSSCRGIWRCLDSCFYSSPAGLKLWTVTSSYSRPWRRRTTGDMCGETDRDAEITITWERPI